MLLIALYWLVLLELFSFAVYPLAYRAFSRLPDRGWALSKPLGLLLTAYITWLIGLSHIVNNSRWSVMLALLAVGGLSWLAGRRAIPEMRTFLRRNASVILSAELLFVAVFLGMTLLRASVPDINHTEQPMDLMFLNATVTSPAYPPNDPWLAGEPVSYYYLGYLMVGAVTLLSGLATAVAYNLGLATMAAMGAIAAFGVTFNLIRLARGSLDGAAIGGIASAFLLLVASNLAGTLELAQAAGAGDAGFWAFINIDGLSAEGASPNWAPDDSGWWWWSASRVIPGAITEFPLFSFVLGDMHPHVMSIGFLLLAAGISVQLYLEKGLLRAESLRARWPLALVSVVAVGALAAINLWDLPIGLAMVSGALLLNAARNGRSHEFGSAVAMTGPLLVVGAPEGNDPDGPGTAYVYERSEHGWRRPARLRGLDSSPGARFGAAIATDGERVLVSAPGASGTGVVHEFTRSDGRWALAGTVRPPEGTEVREFGRAIALGEQTMTIGDRGHVHVYSSRGSRWVHEAELASTRDEDEFGYAVSITPDVVAVGSPRSDGGSAHLFDRSGSLREQGRRGSHRTIIDEPIPGFGRSLATSPGLLIVGGEGTAATFRRRGDGWDREDDLTPTGLSNAASFGGTVDCDGRYAVVGVSQGGDESPQRGSVSLFAIDDPQDQAPASVAGPDSGVDGAFGAAAVIKGSLAVVGSPGSGNGAVYLFRRTLDRWRLERKLVAQWRFAPAAVAVGLLFAAALLAVAPFLLTFESAVNSPLPLPLRLIVTRPVHLLLVWGIPALVVLPAVAMMLRQVFPGPQQSGLRLTTALGLGFAPIAFWLQPVWATPIAGVLLLLFGLHQAGYRMPRADEMLFAYNPRATLAVGQIVVVAGLIGHGIVTNDRALDGEMLALDRMAIAVPLAMVVSLALYGAWTLAHRDSEARRRGRSQGGAGRFDGTVPALLLVAIASALIMGVELFYVSDFFGGDLRRFNTVFKLYYQAWILLAVLGGFGLWYVGGRWDRKVLSGRIGVTVWAALLIAAFGAVSYYPLAAVASRSSGDGFELNGQAYLSRSAPAELMAIEWIRDNTARDAVVVESAVAPCSGNELGCSDFTEAGRISASTGRPTVVGWEQHELQWRSASAEVFARRAHVRTIYETTDVAEAARLLERYGADYVVVGLRERQMYAADGLAKFDSMGELVFDADVRIYELASGSAE